VQMDLLEAALDTLSQHPERHEKRPLLAEGGT